MLIFTYHHSRAEGWASVYRSVCEAGFQIVYTHPVKAEMAVSVPIRQSKAPLNFDLIIVCRKAQKRAVEARATNPPSLKDCVSRTRRVNSELRKASIEVGVGDIKIILMGCALSTLATIGDLETEVERIYQIEGEIDSLAEKIANGKKG